MLDGEEGSEHLGGAESASDGFAFQLDLESSETLDRSAALPGDTAVESAPAAPPASSAGGFPPPPADSRYAAMEERVAAAERRAIEAQSAVAPWLTHMAQLAQPAGGPRRVTREQLLADPNVTVQDLLGYLETQNNEVRTQAQQGAALEARRGASELHARGMLTPEAMGDPDAAFDSMRERYVRPLYEQQPYMRDVIHAMFPDQPSMGEVAVAWVRRIAEAAQQDPVNTYRRLADFMRGGQPAAARQVTRSIQQAADRGAHRVAPGGGARMTGAEARGIKSVNGREMWQLSDAEFDRLDNQLTGGL